MGINKGKHHEVRIVIPVVVGSSPISHPIQISDLASIRVGAFLSLGFM